MNDNNGIFISYRRDGGDGLAGRIRDALNQRGYATFLDVEDLKTGKFNEALFAQIDRSSDFIVVLSPGALDRCRNPDDWVRLEIAYALRQKKNVVPVFGRNFSFPPELPPDIDELRVYNGIGASHELFDASMDKLATLLVAKPAKKAGWHRPALAAIAVVLGAVWFLSHRAPSSTQAPPSGSAAAATGLRPSTSSPSPAVATADSAGASATPAAAPASASGDFDASDFAPKPLQFFTNAANLTGPMLTVQIDFSPRVLAANNLTTVEYSLDGVKFVKSAAGGFLTFGSEVMNADRLHLRFTFWGGKTAGPFAYALDVHGFAMTQMKESILQPLLPGPWVLGDRTGYYLQSAVLTNLPAVSRLDYGTNADLSGATAINQPPIPSLQQFFDSLKGTAFGPRLLQTIPVMASPLYFRLTFFDGTVSPIAKVAAVAGAAPGLPVADNSLTVSENMQRATRLANARNFLSSLHLQPSLGIQSQFGGSLGLNNYAGVIRAIRLGESPNQLDLVYRLPDQDTLWLKQVRTLVMRPGITQAWGQLEFTDGSVGPVQKWETSANDLAPGISLTAPATANHESAPILFVSVGNKFQPAQLGGDELVFQPVNPQLAKKWKFAVDDIRFPEREASDPGWTATVSLAIQGTTARQLQVAWIDEQDKEHGPFAYDLTPVRPMLLRTFKDEFLKSAKSYFNFYVVLPPAPPRTPELSDPQNRSQLAESGLGFITDYGIWAEGALARMSWDHALVGRGWLSVQEVRLGTQPEKLDHVAAPRGALDDFISRKPTTWGARPWTMMLPRSAEYVYAQALFRDGSKSEILRFRVSEMSQFDWQRSGNTLNTLRRLTGWW